MEIWWIATFPQNLVLIRLIVLVLIRLIVEKMCYGLTDDRWMNRRWATDDRATARVC